MNFLNRLVMLIIALLMVAVPVVMLLVAFDYFTGVSADFVDRYTNYQAGLQALGDLTLSDFSQQVRIIIAIVSALVVILALVLLLRELSFGRRLARDVIVEKTPGQETIIKTGAVSSLIEGAAARAGAVSTDVTLSSSGNTYDVHCKIQVPESGNFTETATRARDNIREALDRYSVSHERVEVTVQGTAS